MCTENYSVQPLNDIYALSAIGVAHTTPVTRKLNMGAVFLKCNVEQNRQLVYSNPNDVSNKLIVVEDESNEIHNNLNRITQSFIMYENEECLF